MISGGAVNDRLGPKKVITLGGIMFGGEDREKRALWEAVVALPEKYRVPLYLYYYEGLSVAETAAAMKANVSTVQTWLLRARARLRKELSEEKKEESVYVRPEIIP